MIKRVLVPTDGSDEAFVGVRYAVALAKQTGAKLLGLHVIDIKFLEGPFARDIAASFGTAPFVSYQGNVAVVLGERGKAALEAFKECCKNAGVPCEADQVTGIVARCIVEQCELADMVIMGRSGEHSAWLEGLVGSTTASVVRRAPCPVLITATETPGRRQFIVAYDGSHHAKRALQVAADVGVNWGAPLTVLVAGDARAESVMTDARGYLEAHEVNADFVRREGDPSEVIVAYARERNADLLVMGAYGHTKVRELVVGSTTAYAINHAPCPLLLVR